MNKILRIVSISLVLLFVSGCPKQLIKDVDLGLNIDVPIKKVVDRIDIKKITDSIEIPIKKVIDIENSIDITSPNVDIKDIASPTIDIDEGAITIDNLEIDITSTTIKMFMDNFKFWHGILIILGIAVFFYFKGKFKS